MIDIKQTLALRSALLHHDKALIAWRELKLMQEIEGLDYSVTRILPTVFNNMKNYLDEKDLLKLKGATRHTWAKNTELLKQLEVVIQILNRYEINYRVLKGGAINLLANSPTFRIMGDIDILVSKKELLKTREAILESGLKPKFSYACTHNSKLKLKNELNFINDKSLEIDIHVAEEHTSSELFTQILKNPPKLIKFAHTSFKIPPTEFLVVHSIIHGLLAVDQQDEAQMILDVHLLIGETNLNSLKQLIVRQKLSKTFNEFLNIQKSVMGDSYPLISIGKILDSKFYFQDFAPTKLNYYSFVKIGRIIKLRRPKFRNIFHIAYCCNQNRLLYLIWLFAGLPRPFEKFVSDWLSGFVNKNSFPEETVFPGSKWSNDWRFWISNNLERSRMTIGLTSKAFLNQSFLIFNNGSLVAVTEKCLDGVFMLDLKNPPKINELSIRLPLSGCKICAQELEDLKILKKFN